MRLISVPVQYSGPRRSRADLHMHLLLCGKKCKLVETSAKLQSSGWYTLIYWAGNVFIL